MSATFTYMGDMAILIERDDGYKILVDPHINNGHTKTEPSNFYDVDLILVTHVAYDHFGQTAEILKNGKAHVMCGQEVMYHLEKEGIERARISKTITGDCRTFGQTTTVHTVVCHHHSVCEYDGSISNWPQFGFIVQVEPGLCYYHQGDSNLYTDMRQLRELYKPNVMTVCVSRLLSIYGCPMTPREAALSVSYVMPEVAIATHYEHGSGDLEEFMRNVDVLAPDTIIKKEIDTPFRCTPFRVE
jgi:L-ascorbate metabolism protein UlaG (beta-lactamase superfamily)